MGMGLWPRGSRQPTVRNAMSGYGGLVVKVIAVRPVR